MSFGNDLRDVTRQLEAQGWRHEDTSRGHHKFLPPDPKAPIVICSGTPSDHRSWHNFMAQLRRSGAQLERPKRRRHENSVPSKVLSVMVEQPTKTFSTEELTLIVSARNPEKLKAKTPLKYLVGIALCDLYKQGDLTRVSQGFYRLKSLPPPPAPKPAPKPAPEMTEQPLPLAAEPEPLLPAPTLADGEMKELSAALYESLGVIEKIIAKYNRLHEEHERLKIHARDIRAIVREEIAAALKETK